MLLRLPRDGDPHLTEWARILNEGLARREPLILSAIYDCSKWYVRYLAPYSCTWVQEHLQSTDDGGYLYDPDNYTSSTLIDCRTERMKDFEAAMDAAFGYSLFLIPVQYDGEGNKILYDGVSAEDRMVGITNCCNPPFDKVFMFDMFKVNTITEADTNNGIDIESAHIEDGVGTFTEIDVTQAYKANGTQVIGNQGAAVADAAGGATIDTECRAALNALLARLRTHGLIAS